MRIPILCVFLTLAELIANSAPSAAQRITVSKASTTTATLSADTVTRDQIERLSQEVWGSISRLQSDLQRPWCDGRTIKEIERVEKAAKPLPMLEGQYYGTRQTTKEQANTELTQTSAKWKIRRGEAAEEDRKIAEELLDLKPREFSPASGQPAEVQPETLERLRRNALERQRTIKDVIKTLDRMIADLDETRQRNADQSRVAERLRETARLEALYLEVLFGSMKARVHLTCADEDELPDLPLRRP